MADERVIVSRRELHDQVWSDPRTKLAPNYGLSDVGLAKVCAKHDIPRPPVGHWAKLAHGKATSKPELPELDEADLEEIGFFRAGFEGDTSQESAKPETPFVIVKEDLRKQYIINNVISADKSYLVHGSDPNFSANADGLGVCDYNWLRGTDLCYTPAWLGKHNVLKTGQDLWGDSLIIPPGFPLLPADCGMLDAGLDISQPFTIGKTQNKALPDAVDSCRGKPDIGAMEQRRKLMVQKLIRIFADEKIINIRMRSAFLDLDDDAHADVMRALRDDVVQHELIPAVS